MKLRAACLCPLILLAVFGGSPAFAQGSRADYERADNLWKRWGGRNPAREPIRGDWLSESRYWFRKVDAAGEGQFLVADAEKGSISPLFDEAKVAEGVRKITRGGADRIYRVASDADGLLALVRGEVGVLRIDPRTSEVSLASEQAAEAFAPRRLRRVQPSRAGGNEAWIGFVNRTGGPAKLFWVDTEGDKHQYATIFPGQTHSQHTYVGHVWVALSDEDAVLSVVAATEGTSVAEIRAAGTGPASRAPAEAERAADAGAPDGAAAPPARTRVSVRDNNIFVQLPGGEPATVTTDGTAAEGYERVMLSPDGAKIAAIRTTRVATRRVTYVESRPEEQVQPKVHSYEYAKPGDPLPRPRLVLFSVADRREIPVGDGWWNNPWSLDDLRWEPDSSRVTLVYNQRGHQVMRVLAVDAESGRVMPLVDERCPTFFDYAAKKYMHFTGSNELIWMSERDGWNHLYLIDARVGAVRNQITKGEWVVRGVDRVDDEKRQVWFRACGIIPGQDPYYIQYARINFDGTGLTLLTQGDGTHDVSYSPGGDYLLDRYSRVDMAPVTELRRASDGSLVLTLGATSTADLESAGWRPPERFVAKGRDGTTDIYGLIHRPSNFDPAKRYPVIESIYAGPHDAHVPKRFQVDYRVSQLTELGFIVVQIDGMGTNWRSKSFHDVAWKNLKDAGFPDRIAWMKAAAAVHPEIDLENGGRGVGIYGGSAGGQNAAAAVIWHGDFYKAAAADCGCHDNRMDKVWWNELWMSWPVGPWYEESSNVANAARMPSGCKLLLTVGEMDENVDPASTMQLAAALQKADKDYELVVLAGMGHGAGESGYGYRRRQDFFVRALLGREPRW